MKTEERKRRSGDADRKSRRKEGREKEKNRRLTLESSFAKFGKATHLHSVSSRSIRQNLGIAYKWDGWGRKAFKPLRTVAYQKSLVQEFGLFLPDFKEYLGSTRRWVADGQNISS